MVGESEYVAGKNFKCIVFNFTDPQLGALQVAEYGNIIGLGEVDLANAFNDICFALVAAVRKVETEHVDTRFHQRQQFLVRIACGSYCCNDLCLM